MDVNRREDIPKWATNYPGHSFWIWVWLVKTCHGESHSHIKTRNWQQCKKIVVDVEKMGTEQLFSSLP